MRTIEEQTGWTRPHVAGICQDIEALLRVTEFDYDLTDLSFLVYFKERTGIQIDECECGWFVVIEELANYNVPAPDKSWRITRAKLQDCWQLYQLTQ